MNERIQEIPLEKVVVRDSVRDRYDDKAVLSMALSLKAIGQLYAILVRCVDGAYVVIDGGTRYRAAKKLGWKTIAVVVVDRELCEGEVVHRALSANCARTDLTPIEKARGIAKLMELTGWNATETAAQLGMSNGSITRLNSLLSLPEAIAQQVASGVIALSTAYELSKVADPVKQAELAHEAASGKLTRDAASGQVKQERNGYAKQATKAVSRAVVVLGGGRSISVSGDGITLDKLIAWIEELLAKARKARTQGWELATFTKAVKDESKD